MKHQKEHFVEKYKEDSGPDHLLDCVSRQSVEEHGEEEGEEDDEDDLEDCPLVVVPDDVPDRLQGVEEPHEGGIRSPGKGKGVSKIHVSITTTTSSIISRWFLKSIGILSSKSSRLLLRLFPCHQDQLSLHLGRTNIEIQMLTIIIYKTIIEQIMRIHWKH